jgi:hypothetical protein
MKRFPTRDINEEAIKLFLLKEVILKKRHTNYPISENYTPLKPSVTLSAIPPTMWEKLHR